MKKHIETSNAVIYARYSPGSKQNEQSIEGQVHDCTAYAESKGLNVINVYADRHLTGTESEHRDAFQQMLRDAQQGSFSYVIVWKIDRFGRNREEIAINKVHLKKSGVTLLYAEEHIPEGPEGIILESMLEGMAEYYSAELAQKIRRGQRESVSKGRMIGAWMPYGYVKDADLKLHIDDTAADVVRHIFKMYNAGDLIRDILYDLEAKGITNNGKSFNYNSIRRILRNRIYIGEFVFGPNVNTDMDSRIIDDDTFNLAQQRIAMTAIKSVKMQTAARARATVNYALSGKLICGTCGSEYHGTSGRSHTGVKHYYYICNGKKKNSSLCDSPSFRKDEIENFVFDRTIKSVLTDPMIDQISDMVLRYQEEDSESYVVKSIMNDISACEKSLRNLTKAIESGIITETTLSRMKELEAEKKSLQSSLALANMKHITFTKDQIVFYLKQFATGNTSDDDVREKINQIFIDKVILDKKTITIVYNLVGRTDQMPVDQLLSKVLLHTREVDITCMHANPIIISRSLFFVIFPAS